MFIKNKCVCLYSINSNILNQMNKEFIREAFKIPNMFVLPDEVLNILETYLSFNVADELSKCGVDVVYETEFNIPTLQCSDGSKHKLFNDFNRNLLNEKHIWFDVHISTNTTITIGKVNFSPVFMFSEDNDLFVQTSDEIFNHVFNYKIKNLEPFIHNKKSSFKKVVELVKGDTKNDGGRQIF